MKKKYLVAAKNTDGRLCCWAQSESLEAAKASVDARWPTHGGSGDGCYPGEQRGQDEVHIIHEDGSVTPHDFVTAIPMVAAALAKAEETADVLRALDGLPPRVTPKRRADENDEERAGRERAEEDRFDYLKDEGLLRRP